MQASRGKNRTATDHYAAIAMRGLAGSQPAQASPRCTKCNSPPINGQCTNFISYLLEEGGRRRDRDVEGGRGMGRGCPLPSRLGGLGSVVSSPPAGSGAAENGF